MDISEDLLNVGDANHTDEEIYDMYNNFIQANPEKAAELEKLQSAKEKVLPTPGCCLKTRDIRSDQKVFINVCTSSTVPCPPDITESKLKELVESLEDEDATVDYRVPMSIGEGHAELDNKNTGCTAYDIIINPVFLKKINSSNVFLGFFMSIVIEGIQNKYNIELDRNWVLLKRKKFVGSLQEQYMCTKRLIQEMPGAMSSTASTSEKPKFKILREPEENHPEFLIAEIDLPKVNRAKAISVDVGEDRLVLSVKPQLYELDIFLPFKLVQEECGCQFNINTRVLTITMPVQPQ